MSTEVVTRMGASPSFLGSYVTRVRADLSVAAWNTVATHRMFTLSGMVFYAIFYRVFTVLAGGAGCLISFGITGSGALISPAAAIGLYGAGYFMNPGGVPLSAIGQWAGYDNNNYARGLLDGAGTLHHGYAITVAAATSGILEGTCMWTPISSDGRVVAAAGGVL